MGRYSGGGVQFYLSIDKGVRERNGPCIVWVPDETCHLLNPELSLAASKGYSKSDLEEALKNVSSEKVFRDFPYHAYQTK